MNSGTLNCSITPFDITQLQVGVHSENVYFEVQSPPNAAADFQVPNMGFLGYI